MQLGSVTSGLCNAAGPDDDSPDYVHGVSVAMLKLSRRAIPRLSLPLGVLVNIQRR